VGTFGVDANGKATSGLNHESERTNAASRDGAPCSSNLDHKLMMRAVKKHAKEKWAVLYKGGTENL
jgi:hypothetical protein